MFSENSYSGKYTQESKKKKQTWYWSVVVLEKNRSFVLLRHGLGCK